MMSASAETWRATAVRERRYNQADNPHHQLRSERDYALSNLPVALPRD